MKVYPLVLLALFLAIPVHAQKDANLIEEPPIETIIGNYSARTGTKFVLDPRVNAKVRMIGLELNEIDRQVLINILLLHGYDTVETDSVTYVLPDAMAESIRERLLADKDAIADN